MVRPIEQEPIHLSLDEVAVRAGHEVLMVGDLYFTGCWWSMRDFRPAAQASTNPLINITITLIINVIKL